MFASAGAAPADRAGARRDRRHGRELRALHAGGAELHRRRAPGDGGRGRAVPRGRALRRERRADRRPRASATTGRSPTRGALQATRSPAPPIPGAAAHRHARAQPQRSPATAPAQRRRSRRRSATSANGSTRRRPAARTSQATLRHIEADQPSSGPSPRATSPRRARRSSASSRAHIHVVRVRVNVAEPSGAQRLFYDLGGPYVLAPVHGTLRSGRQDRRRLLLRDPGRRRLHEARASLHRRRGADARRAREAGDGHARARARAAFPTVAASAIEGRDYAAYSFSGVAFPPGRCASRCCSLARR